MIITILAFIIVLSILVLIHELGHYLTAKKLGIKVEEFGFGFPPRVWGKKIGETLYSINLLPIGGFVKLYGEDEAGGGSIKHRSGELQGKVHDLKRAFFARPSWQKLLVVFAGVFMNFVLAVVIITYLFTVPGVTMPGGNVKIVEVTKNSPAVAAGIKPGDEIISANGKKVTYTDEFILITRENKGRELTLELKRAGETINVNVVPRKEFGEGDGPIGVVITTENIVKKYPWYQAPFFGTIEAAKFSFMIFQGIIDAVSQLILHGSKPAGVAGPIGVAELTGKAVSYGFNATLWFIALLSLNLAVVNVLPIPALDGGRLFFILIEVVTRRKVSPKYESLAHATGLALLLTLIVVITILDIVRVASGQSLIPEM